MRRLARWLLVLALPFSSIVTAAPAGGGAAKKGTGKTTAKTTSRPKAASKTEEEEADAVADEKKAGRKKTAKTETVEKSAAKDIPPAKKGEAPKTGGGAEATAAWLRRRGESVDEPTGPDAKAPAPKSSSKVEPQINLEEPPARKPESEIDSKPEASGGRKSGPASKKKTAEPKPGDDETEKKAGQGTKKKSKESAADKPKSKRATQDTTAKSGTKAKPSTDEDKAEPSAKSNAASKTKGKVAAAGKGDAKPILDKAGDPVVERSKETGANATIAPDEIEDFAGNPEGVQTLLRLGLALTERDLTYRYGSSDPDSGGMDCSGTVYYLLRAAGVKDVPRDSSGLYVWAQKAGTLHTVQAASLEDAQFAELRPGDLLFWEGTYGVQRDPPISHTMIYLGREKKTGARVMVGASDGRSYRGIRRNGVSVFDFKLPKADSAARFMGYARVPGLE